MLTAIRVLKGPVPAAFVTGSLDPVSTRAEFLAKLKQQSASVMVMVAEQAPPASKAEMEVMAALPMVEALQRPGFLGMVGEYG